MREHPVRLAVAAAVALVAMTSLVDSSSIVDDDPLRSHVAGPFEAGRSIPATNVTATLILAGPDEEAEADAGSSGDSTAEPDDAPMVEIGGGSATDPDASDGAPSLDQAGQVGSGTPSEPEPDPTPSDPTIEPELSDTVGATEPPAAEPDSADSPESEIPDDETDTGDGTCLGVNALGLTVDLCIPSLLEG